MGRTKDYKINGATLIKLLQQNKMELKENPDEIEELILDMSHVKCVVDNDDNCIIKIESWTPVSEALPEENDDISLMFMCQEPSP